jgi:ribonuclease G
VKPVLLWDAGPGEIRAGLIEDGVLVEFRLIRLRRGERALLAAGERYTARILQKLGNGNALVNLGVEAEVILSPALSLPEGLLLAVTMVRAPIPEPGRWKRARVRPDPDGEVGLEPGWQFSAEPWELFLQRHAPLVEAILCADAGAAHEVSQLLGANAPPIRIDPAAIEEVDFESLIDQAVTGEFPTTGGTISVERTRAMTMIDVDGVGAPLALNLAAAAVLPALLRRFDIGGPIGVDFLTLKSRAERTQVDAALAQASANLGPHERTALNGFGFCQIIRPRPGPSVMELLCGVTPGKLSTETQAIHLLRAAGRSQGFGARQLVARPAIIDLIRTWPEEVGALRSSLGTVIELVPDPSVSGYGHVHVVQN